MAVMVVMLVAPVVPVVSRAGVGCSLVMVVPVVRGGRRRR